MALAISDAVSIDSFSNTIISRFRVGMMLLLDDIP